MATPPILLPPGLVPPQPYDDHSYLTAAYPERIPIYPPAPEPPPAPPPATSIAEASAEADQRMGQSLSDTLQGRIMSLSGKIPLIGPYLQAAQKGGMTDVVLPIVAALSNKDDIAQAAAIRRGFETQYPDQNIVATAARSVPGTALTLGGAVVSGPILPAIQGGLEGQGSARLNAADLRAKGIPVDPAAEDKAAMIHGVVGAGATGAASLLPGVGSFAAKGISNSILRPAVAAGTEMAVQTALGTGQGYISHKIDQATINPASEFDLGRTAALSAISAVPFAGSAAYHAYTNPPVQPFTPPPPAAPEPVRISGLLPGPRRGGTGPLPEPPPGWRGYQMPPPEPPIPESSMPGPRRVVPSTVVESRPLPLEVYQRLLTGPEMPIAEPETARPAISTPETPRQPSEPIQTPPAQNAVASTPVETPPVGPPQQVKPTFRTGAPVKWVNKAGQEETGVVWEDKAERLRVVVQRANGRKALVPRPQLTEYVPMAEPAPPEPRSLTPPPTPGLPSPEGKAAASMPEKPAPPAELPKGNTRAEAEKYVSDMAPSAAPYIRRLIEGGMSPKDAALRWGREIGMGMMDTPDDVYRKIRGGLYSTSYVRSVLTTKEGVAVNAKEYFAAVDEGRQEGIQWKSSLQKSPSPAPPEPSPAAPALQTETPAARTSTPIAEGDVAISRRRAELIDRIRHEVVTGTRENWDYYTSRAAKANPNLSVRKQQNAKKIATGTRVVQGSMEPKSLIRPEEALAEAEKMPEGSPARMLLQNLRELEANPRGTKIGAFDTNKLPDGAQVQVNPDEVWTVDKQQGEIRDKITTEIPEEGATIYGRRVLPETLPEVPKGEFAPPEPPALEESSRTRPTLFGQEVAAGTGKQQELGFHEPAPAPPRPGPDDTAADVKLRAQNKNTPTGELFTKTGEPNAQQKPESAQPHANGGRPQERQGADERGAGVPERRPAEREVPGQAKEEAAPAQGQAHDAGNAAQRNAPEANANAGNDVRTVKAGIAELSNLYQHLPDTHPKKEEVRRAFAFYHKNARGENPQDAANIWRSVDNLRELVKPPTSVEELRAKGIAPLSEDHPAVAAVKAANTELAAARKELTAGKVKAINKALASRFVKEATKERYRAAQKNLRNVNDVADREALLAALEPYKDQPWAADEIRKANLLITARKGGIGEDVIKSAAKAEGAGGIGKEQAKEIFGEDIQFSLKPSHAAAVRDIIRQLREAGKNAEADRMEASLAEARNILGEEQPKAARSAPPVSDQSHTVAGAVKDFVSTMDRADVTPTHIDRLLNSLKAFDKPTLDGVAADLGIAGSNRTAGEGLRKIRQHLYGQAEAASRVATMAEGVGTPAKPSADAAVDAIITRLTPRAEPTSLRPSEGQGITPDAAESAIAPLRKRFKNPTRVWANADAIPADVKIAPETLARIKSPEFRTRVEGFVDNDGTVHLIASNLESPDRARVVWAQHEIIGHLGAEKTFQNADGTLNPMGERVMKFARQNEAKLVEAVASDYGPDKQVAETFARLAEKYADKPQPAWYQRALDYVRYHWRRLTGQMMTRADVERVFRVAAKRSGEGAAREAASVAPQPALTPADTSAINELVQGIFTLNRALHQGKTLNTEQAAKVARIDAAIAKLPETTETSYRGVSLRDIDAGSTGFRDAFLKQHRVGDTVQYGGYLHAYGTKQAARAEAYIPADPGATARLIIKGTGRKIGEAARAFPELSKIEDEVVYPRNSRFRVTKIETAPNGRTDVWLEQVGPEQERFSVKPKEGKRPKSITGERLNPEASEEIRLRNKAEVAAAQKAAKQAAQRVASKTPPEAAGADPRNPGAWAWGKEKLRNRVNMMDEMFGQDSDAYRIGVREMADAYDFGRTPEVMEKTVAFEKLAADAGIERGTRAYDSWINTQHTLNLPDAGPVKLTRAEMTNVYAISGDPAGAKAIEGGKQAFNVGRNLEGPEFALTPRDVAEITRQLTPKERAIADGLKVQVNTFKDRLLNVVEELTGKRPTEVGEGYWSMERNMRKEGARGQNRTWREALAADIEHVAPALERAANNRPIVIRGIHEAYNDHVHAASRLIHMAKPVHRLAWILKSPDVREAVQAKYGRGALNDFDRYLGDLLDEHISHDPMGHAASWAMRNFGRATFALNPRPVVMNAIPGTLVMRERFDGKYAKAGYKAIFDPATYRELMQIAPIWDRYNDQGVMAQHTYSALAAKHVQSSRLGFGAAVKAVFTPEGATFRDKIRNSLRHVGQAVDALPFMRWGDIVPWAFGWGAAKAEARAVHPDWTPQQQHDYAVRKLLSAGRETQNGNTPWEISNLDSASQRSTVGRILTFATRDNQKKYNLIVGGKGTAQIARRTAFVVASSLLYAGISAAFKAGPREVGEAIAGAPGSEDDARNDAINASWDFTQNLSGTVFGGDRVVGAMRRLMTGKRGIDITSNPPEQMLESVATDVSDLSNAIQAYWDLDPKKAEQATNKLLKALYGTGRDVSVISGLPFAPTARIAERGVKGATFDTEEAYKEAMKKARAIDKHEKLLRANPEMQAAADEYADQHRRELEFYKWGQDLMGKDVPVTAKDVFYKAWREEGSAPDRYGFEEDLNRLEASARKYEDAKKLLKDPTKRSEARQEMLANRLSTRDENKLVRLRKIKSAISRVETQATTHQITERQAEVLIDKLVRSAGRR